MPSNRRLTTLAGAVFVGAAATAMFAAPASAHAATVSGEAQCAANGTYTIHWTIQNKRFENSNGWTLILKNVTPTGLKDDQGTALEGHEIAPNGSLTFDQKNVPGTDTSTKLSFNATWSDEWRDDTTYSGSVTLGGDCKEVPPPPTKSASPSASPSAKPSASGTAGGETSPTPSKSTTAPALPVTGSQTGLLAGGAVVLLGAGAGLFVMARRRRLKFEA